MSVLLFHRFTVDDEDEGPSEFDRRDTWFHSEKVSDLGEQRHRDAIHELLPASFREDNDKLIPGSRDISECIKHELDLDRLTTIIDWLWLVGRPMPPRPLYHQLLISREPFLTQRMDMHLVWIKGKIFLKPIPRFLFEPQFWMDHLSCKPNCECTMALNARKASGIRAFHQERPCPRRKLRKRALGFLFSYTGLIAYESDLQVAKDKRLVPSDLTWPKWRIFVEELLAEDLFRNIDARFIYGELRLSRLNLIYFFRGLRPYMKFWNRYGDFFGANFTVLASATVYMAIVLTAIQVGLTLDRLQNNASFLSASYGFTVFAILGPLVFLGCVLMMFLYLIVYNLVQTLRYSKKRFGEIQDTYGAS
ncbi:hypothetical protein PT974_01284 [Cladobotryum mycophilum]|uniref:Subtilisin-like serine protease n=1 Tax=Cladobotryum mycophilum TaxID=491253 RepID=A0ABR0T4D8_9HYPO